MPVWKVSLKHYHSSGKCYWSEHANEKKVAGILSHIYHVLMKHGTQTKYCTHTAEHNVSLRNGTLTLLTNHYIDVIMTTCGVSNHQPNGCLLNRLFGRRSKKTSKLRVTGLCAGNSQGTVNSPHKWPVTRKMFPFDDVIMIWPSMFS